VKNMKYLLILMIVSGCSTKIPATGTKFLGKIYSEDGTADLKILFDPPSNFRVFGDHPILGRKLDIGGDGKIIWFKTDNEEFLIKGKIIIDDSRPWQANKRSFSR